MKRLHIKLTHCLLSSQPGSVEIKCFRVGDGVPGQIRTRPAFADLPKNGDFLFPHFPSVN